MAAKLLVFAPQILAQIRSDCAGVDAGRRENRKRDPACGGPGLRQTRRPQNDDVLRVVRKPKGTGRIAYATMHKTQRRQRPEQLLHEFCVLDVPDIFSISLTPPSGQFCRTDRGFPCACGLRRIFPAAALRRSPASGGRGAAIPARKISLLCCPSTSRGW